MAQKKKAKANTSEAPKQAELALKAKEVIKQPTQPNKGGNKMDFIEVPKDMGGDLRNDMEGVVSGELSKLHWGTSKQNKPKVTMEFILTEDISGIDPPTTGEKVLEACSLQSQALWKINGYYKQVKDEDIPAGNMSFDEFKGLIEDALIGTSWDLELQIGADEKGNARTQVHSAAFKG